VDLNRRRLVQSFAIGIGWAAMARTGISTKTARDSKIKTSSPYLLRPPGALPEDEFLDTCIRCGECMKVCPTNGLQPAVTEAGMEGFWSPLLVPRIGECTQNCNLCSEVCATQAIQPFTVAEKNFLFIGTAVIDRSACIVWNSDKPCLICDEYCSYHALKWKNVDGVRRPFVNEAVCTGCGICESACPIQPLAAIRVYSFGDKRHMTRDEQRRWSETNNQN
jgi:ferredoxin